MPGRSFEVRLGDVIVGFLGEGADGRIVFRFQDSYRDLEKRPVLSQSFEDDLERPYWGKRPGQLPAFFENLLPEGVLRTLIEKSLQIPERDDLALLAAVDDIPGAVLVRASQLTLPLPVTAKPAEEIAPPVAEQEEVDGLRFSLAGVQLKFSMIRNQDRFTLPAHDHLGSWIVKAGSLEYNGLAENEWAMLEWARRCGISVPETQLVEATQLEAIREYVPGGTRALAIRRYDRENDRRIHQEDFAQVIGASPSKKYDFTFDGVLKLGLALLGDEGYFELIRRIAFTIGIGNADAHLKNWSLLYPDAVTPELTPFYDQVSTIAWPRIERRLAMKLAGAKDFGRLDADCFRRVANRVGIDEGRTVDVATEMVSLLRENWSRLRRETKLPDEHAAALREHWLRVPLLRAAGELD